MHTCHAYGCTRKVLPRMFACREHWFALPTPVRDAIWREYRSGQEITKRPTVRYMAVQRFAVARTAFKPNDEEAARVAAEYMAQAIDYQRQAIAAGAGDPLIGLVP